MDEADAFSKYLALEAVFQYVDVKGLLICMDVCQLWRLAAIPHLRRRLTFITLPCISEVDADKARSMCGADVRCSYVMHFLLALKRCRRLAAAAGMKLSLLVVFFSGDFEKLTDGFAQLRSLLNDDCVVLQFGLNPSCYKFCACQATQHSIILGSLLFTADINAQISASATLGIPVVYDRHDNVR